MSRQYPKFPPNMTPEQLETAHRDLERKRCVGRPRGKGPTKSQRSITLPVPLLRQLMAANTDDIPPVDWLSHVVLVGLAHRSTCGEVVARDRWNTPAVKYSRYFRTDIWRCLDGIRSEFQTVRMSSVRIRVGCQACKCCTCTPGYVEVPKREIFPPTRVELLAGLIRHGLTKIKQPCPAGQSYQFPPKTDQSPDGVSDPLAGLI